MRDELQAIFNEATGKYKTDAKKYGRFDPATDGRDLRIEAEQKILDAVNYLAMLIIKIRGSTTVNPARNRSRGKNTERQIAKHLGGKQILGRDDVQAGPFTIEVKDRACFVGRALWSK